MEKEGCGTGTLGVSVISDVCTGVCNGGDTGTWIHPAMIETAKISVRMGTALFIWGVLGAVIYYINLPSKKSLLAGKNSVGFNTGRGEYIINPLKQGILTRLLPDV
jgi:hypothetical protein